MTDSTSKNDSVEQLAEEFLQRRRHGEKATISEYCAKYPDKAEQIRELLGTMELMEDFHPASADEGTAHHGRQPDLEEVGGYRIIGEIGRGGMGVVYEAEQESLGRRVALKVLPHYSRFSEVARNRFLREARAAASMHHTNIVPVFETGEEHDCFFYTMQLIHGQSLDLVIEELKDLRSADGGSAAGQSDLLRQDSDNVRLPSDGSGSTDSATPPGGKDGASIGSSRRRFYQSVARIGLQVTGALAYAHAHGMVHRDIKPSNLLLDAEGVVWVTDFGLVKTDDEGLTQSGDFLGTLRYMSPERFSGRCDTRADVYSLGVTLYELLVGRSTYQTTDRLKLVDSIRHTDPPTPRSLDRRIPRDLETIILKSIEREPKSRYQSAKEFAADLHRFVDDLPIRARRVSITEQAFRWAKRNRALAASLSAAFILSVILAVVATLAAWHFRVQETVQRNLVLDREAETRRALAAESKMQRGLYSSQMSLAGESLRSAGGILRVRQLTDAWLPSNSGTDLRGWEWYYLWSVCRRPHLQTQGHVGFAWSVDWSGANKLIASSGSNGNVKVWDAQTGELVTTTEMRGQARSVRWNPDGTCLAIANDRDIAVWDVAKKTPGLRIRGAHDGIIRRVVWHPDGTRLASAGEDGIVKIWDAVNGNAISQIEGQARSMVAWSADGTMLATTGRVATIGREGVVHVWDANTYQRKQSFEANGVVTAVSFHPDGKQLAAAGDAINVWNLASGKTMAAIAVPHKVISVAWNATGERLATGNWDGTVRIYEPSTGVEVDILYDHPYRVWDVSWCKDGNHVASASLDGAVNIWPLADSKTNHTLLQQAGPEYVTWSPDNSRFAARLGKDVLVWDSPTKEPRYLLGHTKAPDGLCWSPDGTRLASSARSEAARIWDVEQGTVVHILAEENANSRTVGWSPDGTKLAVAGTDIVTIWNADSGKPIKKLSGHVGEVVSLDWSPDGKQLAVSGTDSALHVYDILSGVVQFVLEGHSEAVRCVRWSPDGSSLASAGRDRTVRIWDVTTKRSRLLLRGHSRTVNSLSWNRDGSRLVTVGDDAMLRIWDSETGAEVVTLSGHRSHIGAVDWSSDGRRIISSSWDRTIRIWDASRGYEQSESP